MQVIDYQRWKSVLTQEVVSFFEKHKHLAIDKMALLKPKFPAIPFPEILEQLDSVRKLKDKLPAWASVPTLLLPSLAFQQASSEATAHFKSTLIQGNKIADLTGGLGVDSYYLARQGRQVWHIESNADLQAITAHNFAALQQENVAFVNQTAEFFVADLVAREDKSFDALYIDPARRGKEGQKLVLLEDYSPNMVELLPEMLKVTGHVWLKTSPLLDISQASLGLGKVAEVYVIAHENEVKELLFHLTPAPTKDINIQATTLKAGQNIAFSFTHTEETQALPTYSEPLEYLYEPLPALMKAGAFKCFATRFGLAKLQAHTHLYTCKVLNTDVPARIFEVQGVYPYKKKALPTEKAHITTRNFRDSVAQIRQKLQIAEGGDAYIFATTLQNGSQVLLLTKKV